MIVDVLSAAAVSSAGRLFTHDHGALHRLQCVCKSFGRRKGAAACEQKQRFRWIQRPWHGGQRPERSGALILIPAIESLVRLRAEQRGLGVSTAAVGHHRAGFKSLGELLSALSGHMDESWRRYLICVLVNEYRLNLRNNLCHGIMLSASPSDVVVLLIAALYLLRLPAPAAPAVAEASNERAQPAE